MIASAGPALAEHPFAALLAAAFSGVPYKVFAAAAAGAGISAPVFVVMTIGARTPRFLAVVAATVVIDRLAANWLDLRTRSLILAAVWIAFYAPRTAAVLLLVALATTDAPMSETAEKTIRKRWPVCFRSRSRRSNSSLPTWATAELADLNSLVSRLSRVWNARLDMRERAELYDLAARVTRVASEPDDLRLSALQHLRNRLGSSCRPRGRRARRSVLASATDARCGGRHEHHRPHGLGFSDFDRALRFYEKALAPLGITVVMKLDPAETGGYEGAGLGRDGKPSFWIAPGGKTAPHTHVAFVADSRAAVDAFYEAALAAGGTDNGPPGIRAALPPELLRRLRARSRRPQHRGRLPQAGIGGPAPAALGEPSRQCV